MCLEEKLLTEFAIEKNNKKDGRRASCKICTSKRIKEYFEKNPDKKKESDKRSYEENKARKLAQKKEYYLKNKEEILEKTRKYLLWTMIATIAFFVLPLVGLLFIVPSFISSYTSSLTELTQ